MTYFSKALALLIGGVLLGAAPKAGALANSIDLEMATSPVAQENTPPTKPRVVSLDHCSDQYVLALADREQILALSPAARSEYSYMRDKAVGIPTVRSTAEEVLMLGPDKVMRQWGGGYEATEVLTRFGLPVVKIQNGHSIKTMRNNLLIAGEALEQMDRAQALIDDFDARHARLLEFWETEKPSAIYITPSSSTTGGETYIDQLLNLGGVENLMANTGRTGWVPLNLEALALTPPDLVVTGYFDLKTNHQNHWSIARHNFLRQILKNTPTVHIPSDELSCSAWFNLYAAERILEARQKLLAPSKEGRADDLP